MKRIERLVSESATKPGVWTPTHYMSLKQARDANPGEYPSHFRVATGEPIRIIVSDLPTIHKTRFKELGYWNVPSSPGEGPSFWQCVDLTGDRPAQVGTQYATKAELLANLEAYATEYGCDGANPRPDTFQRVCQAAAVARAQGYAGVIFTPEELEGASVNLVQNRLVELGWEVISDLKPESPDPAKERLEYLRGELRAERISYGELAELQSLADSIEPGDIELLEAAGVPETPADRSRDDAGAADPRNDRED